MKKRCVDCGPDGSRPAPHPGPRCTTHHRLILRERKQRQHDLYVQNTYGLTAGEYQRIYEYQGGYCYICQRATGKKRRLAVDHDHDCCPNLPGCGSCVRGLLCKSCNRTLGFFRDDAEAFLRAADYLRNPPLKRMRDASTTPAE